MSVARRPARQERVRGFSGAFTLPLLIVLALLVMGSAGLWTLAQASDVTERGYRLREMEQARSEWQAKVQRLEIETASLASLERLQREAKQRLAMGPPQNTIYLAVSSQGIDSPHVPARFLLDLPIERPPQRSWWQVLRRLLPLP